MTHSIQASHDRDQLTLFGPTLQVQIGFDQNSLQGPFAALVDTGATESCIDRQLALSLKLPQVDEWYVAGSAGRHKVPVHLGEISIPALSFTIYGKFSVVDLVAGGQSHHALLGRTFLQHVTMVYNGPTGEVTLSRD